MLSQIFRHEMISANDLDALPFGLLHRQTAQWVMVLNMYDIRLSGINYVPDLRGRRNGHGKIWIFWSYCNRTHSFQVDPITLPAVDMALNRWKHGGDIVAALCKPFCQVD